MYKKLSASLVCIFILTSCSYFNVGTNKSSDKYSRCKEIKRQMVYVTNTNSNQMSGALSNNLTTVNQMVGAQNSALQDNLNREYRENGCT